ncbi:MAG: CpsB/CapC family capsule biosynthesis tyrosine phosphatase [Solibacillus sp.]
MFDIHSHLLFGVDDGPETVDDSLEMLTQAAKEGITQIIATSHATHPMFHTAAEDIQRQVPLLQQKLNEQGIPLQIHTGHEIRVTDQTITQLQTGHVLPLANSRYVLLELPSATVPPFVKNLIVELVKDGYVPIIAHPERNKAIAEKPERLEVLIREGAVAQITAGSLSGHFGKAIQQVSVQLVEANLVHTYGSDAHNLKTRPFLFNEGLDFLDKKKLGKTVDILLENNARILDNRELYLLEPQQIKRKKIFGLF